jgi:CRISPR-associated protein Cas2
MTSYIICYDIEDNRRRNKVSKLLESYGSRLQYSVFEVTFLEDRELQKLQYLMGEIVTDEDKVFFFLMTEHARRRSFSINRQPISKQSGTYII